MIPVGGSIQNILEVAYRTHSPERIAKVWRLYNQFYFALCKEHSWLWLRDTITLDFTSTEASEELGMRLPSNVFGIDRVRDEDNNIEFIDRNSHDVDPDEDLHRFYTYHASDTAAFPGTDLVLNSGDTGTTTFASALLTADGTDYTGEYVKFGSELGYYLLSAAMTFGPTYFGPNINPLTPGDFAIRPKETLTLNIVDTGKSPMLDRTVTVYYWKAPSVLYRESDMVMLPSLKALELQVMREMSETKERRPVSQGEIDRAVAKTLTLNPDAPRPSRPRDVHNELFTMTQSPYKRR